MLCFFMPCIRKILPFAKDKNFSVTAFVDVFLYYFILFSSDYVFTVT